MSRNMFGALFVSCSVIIWSGILCNVTAELSAEFVNSTDASIDTLRKRACTLTIGLAGQPVANKTVGIRQIRSHFGFGACFNKELGFGVDSAKYCDAFSRYFEWATPENCMKWTYTDEMDDYQDYDDADQLVSWCEVHDINVRGHNLFWNEHTDWLPNWTKELTSAEAFKTAMNRRIQSAMTHFNGKLAHWDIINELIHGRDHTTPEVTMLDSATGESDIFLWILNEARKIDTTARFTVNEYAIVESYSNEGTHSIFINKVLDLIKLGAPIDIVGLEGHFGDVMDQADYKAKLDFVSSYISRPIWLTEVDFTADTTVRADKLEELMRTAYAHPNVGGLVLWVWWEGRRWREALNSVLVDSAFVENDMGVRWRMMRDKWKTATNRTSDANGNVVFTGFHGKYVAQVVDGEKFYADTFYLDPGAEVKSVNVNLVEVAPFEPVGIAEVRPRSMKTLPMRLNRRTVLLNLPSERTTEILLSTYSVSGRLLSSRKLSIKDGCDIISHLPAGCHIYRISAEGRTLYTGVGLQFDR